MVNFSEIKARLDKLRLRVDGCISANEKSKWYLSEIEREFLESDKWSSLLSSHITKAYLNTIKDGNGQSREDPRQLQSIEYDERVILKYLVSRSIILKQVTNAYCDEYREIPDSLLDKPISYCKENINSPKFRGEAKRILNVRLIYNFGLAVLCDKIIRMHDAFIDCMYRINKCNARNVVLYNQSYLDSLKDNIDSYYERLSIEGAGAIASSETESHLKNLSSWIMETEGCLLGIEMGINKYESKLSSMVTSIQSLNCRSITLCDLSELIIPPADYCETIAIENPDSSLRCSYAFPPNITSKRPDLRCNIL